MESILELLSAGMTIDEVLADYPDLEREGIFAALEFGARAAGRRRVVPHGEQRHADASWAPRVSLTCLRWRRRRSRSYGSSGER